ncbi:ribonuclease E [Variibacter gotjawalensis]|uniref:Ribonuclease E n=1 Tax=Variibacter gotjawalensis TaxID=1333996 RepID=A0A0S3PY56_9BRAD|nr:ribonuclease E/G [Variibacter gotjawalensis]NIK46706.1 ribonuclease E [Variibacter gotjawalensis]RZS48609.1 RNAse E [Variibacter gotjawalensis]BAT60871.1 ribonuclease E [Variibacter gotjawalensis]
MANKMLIDSTHPEETRVVVVRGNRVEEFDFESASRQQLRGNIYLAKVTRVEPSLQAAFVEYGGNRHGFLAFSEIHPDYYQIPVADRQALLDEEERAHREEEDEEERRPSRGRGRRHRSSRSRDDVKRGRPVEGESRDSHDQDNQDHHDHDGEGTHGEHRDDHEHHAETGDAVGIVETDRTDNMQGLPPGTHETQATVGNPDTTLFDAGAKPADEDPTAPRTLNQLAEQVDEILKPFDRPHDEAKSDEAPRFASDETQLHGSAEAEAADKHGDEHHDDEKHDDEHHADGEHGGHGDVEDAPHDDEEEDEGVESVGGADALEEVQERRAPRYRKQYKIQEVIKRRQVLLVQVVKEERGSKGAALTTYLSLAGRYSVLMPNTARGGGISRKITSSDDRKRLKEIAGELEVPEGMGVILRTAGANRTKPEVKRDFEYLLRMWETVRDVTLKSSAPTLVYEEGSLIKRSIRDLYNKDIDEVTVAGDTGYREAKDFMRMLMPSHARNVRLYKDPQALFTRHGIESQLDAMFSPVVQLRSGGYIVINQTEALVSIDVNSGRSTREHHIEDTALKTNVEAAEEVARQLRLRDLAGLIVIDFIDMDEKRNNRTVERKMKEALKHDRARIQVGRISHFGLLEMSRQRIRTSVLESSTEKCPHCGGTGHMRSTSSLTLQLLRSLEEQLLKQATHNMLVRTRSEIALYVLNHKRAHLRMLEERYQITITITADAAINGQQPFLIERGDVVHTPDAARAIAQRQQELLRNASVAEEDEDDFVEIEIENEDDESADENESGEESETSAREDGEGEGEEGNRRPRRRRRRRGRGGRGGDRPENGEDTEQHADGEAPQQETAGDDAEGEGEDDEQTSEAGGETADGAAQTDEGRRRRRGRRGGRRNRRDREERGDRDQAPQNADAAVGEAAPDSASWQEWPVQAEATGASSETSSESPAQPAVTASAESEAPIAALPITETVTPPPAAEAPKAAEAPATAPAAEEAKPRRRSTVRESAPVSVESGEYTPPPPPRDIAALPSEPPAPAAIPVEDDRPRRTGWWSRKVLGRE